MTNFDERPVLIVDDSHMYRTSAARMLNKLGLDNKQIVLSVDAAQAIAACKSNQFQMAIIDYNLGSKANGYQLLDDIRNQELIPPDCVVIVLTGEASSDVVHSFSELNPDGYLVKPLSFNTFKTRIPKLLGQKRSLAAILWSIKNSNYDQGLEACDAVMFETDEVSKQAILLRIQLLLLKGDMETARNLLVSLNANMSTDMFSATLAEIAIAKRQYSMAEYILTSHLKRNANSPKEQSLLAELYFRTGKIELAQQTIAVAIELSPAVVDRHWLLLCGHLVANQNAEVVATAQNIIHHSQHSSRHKLAIYQLAASAIIDNAMKYDFNERDMIIRDLKPLLNGWRNHFSSHEYRPFELLIMARAYFGVGYASRGTALLKEYKSLSAERKIGALEITEKLKLASQIKDFDDISKLQEELGQAMVKLGQDTYALLPDSLRRYIAIWRNQFNANQQAYEKCEQNVQFALESGNFDAAAEMLVEMFFSGVQLTFDVPRRLLQTLSKGWPRGMGRKQVAKLACKCKESLLDDQNFPSESESKLLCTLSSQLDYPELKHK